MCVIAIAERVRPSTEQVKQMWEANKHGGGVAWRETEGNETFVRWRKGLNLEEMQEFNKILPLPYVLHFRVPSANTMTGPFGCHPFPVEPGVSVSLEGKISGSVLFHNGHWNSWKHEVKEAAMKGHFRLPLGGWSDTRGLAWMAANLGPGILEFIDEKVVIFGPGEEDIDIIGSWLWADGDNGESFLVSNKGWEKAVPYHAGPVHSLPSGSGERKEESKEKTGGSSQQSTFPRNIRGEGAGNSTGLQGQEANAQTEEQKYQCALQRAQSGAGKKEEGETRGVETGAVGERRIAAVLPFQGKACTKCRSLKDGTEYKGEWLCYTCWGIENRRETELRCSVRQPVVLGPTTIPILDGDQTGLCNQCKNQTSSWRLVNDDTWICVSCHYKAGRPHTYFGPKGLEARIKAGIARLERLGFMPFIGGVQ